MASDLDWADDVGGAKASEGSVYPLPGSYVVELLKVKAGKTRKGVRNFIAELLITESNNPARPVGTMMDWYVDMSKEPALGNVKAFLKAAMSQLAGETVPESQIDGDAVRLAVSDGNPLRGVTLRLSASNIKTKAGGDFTKCRFTPMSEAPAAE